MTMAHIYAWPILPDRLRAARRLIQSLRSKGGVFTLDADRRGWRLKTPKTFRLPVELLEEAFELGDEILYVLREENPGDLALDD